MLEYNAKCIMVVVSKCIKTVSAFMYFNYCGKNWQIRWIVGKSPKFSNLRNCYPFALIRQAFLQIV